MTRPSSVTVVIPCFNYGRFLNDSLSSISAQTLQPLEVVIVDDGSTDPETLAIIGNLERTGIKVIHQENRGLAGARNSGIRSASAEYVYFLDADDMMFPCCLQTLSELLDEDREAIAACSGVKLKGGKQNGTEWRASYSSYGILVQNSWAAGIMLRKSRVEQRALWYDEAMRHGYEDWEFNIRLVESGERIRVFPGALYHYRIHRNSMLTSSRIRHVELVSYIRGKHATLYTAKNLLELKRIDTPALTVQTPPAECSDMGRWLATQTFQDCRVTGEINTTNSRYRLFHAGLPALKRLPLEAIESAIMALEAGLSETACVLAVRLSGSASLGTAWRQELCQPVAVVVRSQSSPVITDVQTTLATSGTLLRFADQWPECESGWTPIDLSSFAARPWNLRDPVAIRKSLSRWGERFFGMTVKQYFVSVYDFVYYQVLSSQAVSKIRRGVAQILGDQTENIVAKIVYGFFLAKPQPREHVSAEPSLRAGDPAPLFLSRRSNEPSSANLLIATAWLNQGGVEQELLDLCKYLDPSRFKLIVATTRRSTHPWENRLRKFPVHVYHLADFLTPQQIRRGLAHLILNHSIDVLHIIHSREAYEALPLIKTICPYVCISDRNVTFAGGFPKISAKIAGAALDVRTVGHLQLAQQMSAAHGLRREALKVIHAGTDLEELQQAASIGQGGLHRMCNLRPGVPIVLFMGRLDPEKRPQVFVRTAAEILRMCPDHPAHFAMVGDGKMRGQIETDVIKLGLKGRLHVLGFHLDRHSLILDSTLLIITSAYEGLALVSFEAMAVGTPQISADVGGQSELITPETGILVKNGRGEIERYARACLELLSDCDRRARMAAAGKKRIQNYFSAEEAVKQYAEIFEQMAELSRKRAAEIPHLRPPHINPLHELY